MHVDRILTYESTLIPGSTIGKHLRHTLDHYRLLLESVPPSSSMAGPLEVNYDTRMRLLDMEGDPAVALRSFEEVERLLDAAADRMSLDKPVKLTALTPHHQEFESSFGREVRACVSCHSRSPRCQADPLLLPLTKQLWFVALHAIHHYSLLRVIATGELRMRLPDNFGVAPSTLAFREYAKATSGRSKEEKPEQAARGAEQLASKVKL